MAGTSKGQDTTQVQQGPADVWVITTAPADATPRLTLCSDGTPDSTANPGTHLGILPGAVTTVAKPKIEGIKADQADASVDGYIAEMDMSIEAEYSQMSAAKLQRALGVGTYAAGSGYKQVTFGGTTTVPTACVAVISKQRSAPTLYVYALMYKAAALTGFAIAFGRAKAASYKIKMAGLADLTRTAGKQIGLVVRNITAPAGTNPTAKDLTVSEIQQGPASLWLLPTPPTDGAVRMTLDATTLTPDATAHPSSVGLGLTAGAATLTVTPKIEAIKADQADAPVDYYCTELMAKLEVELDQAGFDKLQHALGTGSTAYSIDAGGTPAWEQLGAGGLTAPEEVGVCVIAPKRSDNTKVWVGVLYKVLSQDGISYVMTRAKPALYKVTFEGLADLARTAGQQQGVVYETV